MLKEDSYTSSKLQSFYNEELLHPQDMQRKMDDIINKRDKVVDEAIDVSAGINLSNNISADSLRSIAKEFYKLKNYKLRPGICRSTYIIYNGLYELVSKNFNVGGSGEIIYNEDVFRNPYWNLFSNVNGSFSYYNDFFSRYSYGTVSKIGLKIYGLRSIACSSNQDLGYRYSTNSGDEVEANLYNYYDEIEVNNIPFFSVDDDGVTRNINRQIDLTRNLDVLDIYDPNLGYWNFVRFDVAKTKMPIIFEEDHDSYDREYVDDIPAIGNSDFRTGTFVKADDNMFFFLDVDQLDISYSFSSNIAKIYAVKMEFDGTKPVLRVVSSDIFDFFKLSDVRSLVYSKTENGKEHLYQHNIMMNAIKDSTGKYHICISLSIPETTVPLPMTEIAITTFDPTSQQFSFTGENLVSGFVSIWLVGHAGGSIFPPVSKIVGTFETCYNVDYPEAIDNIKEFKNYNPWGTSYPTSSLYVNCNIPSINLTYKKGGVGQSTYIIGPLYYYGGTSYGSRDAGFRVFYDYNYDFDSWDTTSTGSYIAPLKASFITLYNVALSMLHGSENLNIPAIAFHVQSTPYADEEDPNWTGWTPDHCHDRIYCVCYVRDELCLLVNWRTANSTSYDSAVVIPIINKTRLANDTVLRKSMTDSNKIIFHEDASTKTITFTNDSPFKFTIKNIDSKHTCVKDIVCEAEYILPDRTDMRFRLYECKWNTLFLPVTYGDPFRSGYANKVEPSLQIDNLNNRFDVYNYLYSDLNGEVYYLFDKLMIDPTSLVPGGRPILNIVYESRSNSELILRLRDDLGLGVNIDCETLDGVHWSITNYTHRDICYNNFSSFTFGPVSRKIFVPKALIDINRKNVIQNADGTMSPISLSVDDSGIGFFGGVDVQRLPFYMVLNQTGINGPIIASGFPSKSYNSWFGKPYKNRPIYELALVLLNKLETPIIPFLFYGDNLFFKGQNDVVDTSAGNVKTRLHVYCPTELVPYYTVNKDSLFKKSIDDQDMEIEIIDINFLKQILPSELTTIDELKNDSYFVEMDNEGNNIKFRNYFDKRYFGTRMSFDDKCKVLEVYPVYENKSLDNDRYISPTNSLKYHPIFEPVSEIRVKYNDRLNGAIELYINRLSRTVRVTSSSGSIHGCVYFTSRANITNTGYNIVTAGDRVSDFFIKFYRDDDGSMVDGDTIFWDAEIEIDNVNDCKYRIVSISDEQITVTEGDASSPVDLSNSVFINSVNSGSYIDAETPYSDKYMGIEKSDNMGADMYHFRSLFAIDTTQWPYSDMIKVEF